MFLKRSFIIGIIIILLSTKNAFPFLIKNENDLYSANYLKNYLYGSILHNNNQHNLAAKNLDQIDRLKGQHYDYDIKYITSLLINGNLDLAAKTVFDIEKVYSDIFIFDFIKLIYFLKNQEFEKSLIQIKKIKTNDPVFAELLNNIIFWINIANQKNSSKELIKNFQSNYPSIKAINQFLSSRYVSNKKLYDIYNKEILDADNLVRYKILSSWNNIRDRENELALKNLYLLLSEDNNNLLLKQSFIDIKAKKYKIINFFNPEEFNHNLSEIFYIFANIYQQRDDHVYFEILLSISLDFNKNFISNNLANFENKIINNKNFQFDYLFLSKLKNIGSEYKWYVDYQLAAHNEKKDIKNLANSISSNDYFLKSKYLDLANYYRAQKDYKIALGYYKKVEAVDQSLDWTFYYYMGICYERLKQWEMSEKNLKKSLQISPDEYSVINYLAYSWLERNQNLKEATNMLEKAVKLSKWDKGYIIDSLGWAYFLQKDFDKAERLLKIAYEKNTDESEVYDHYGDVLWMQKKFLQARYVWKNALNLENIDIKRKESIKNKILNGLIK